MRRFDTQAGLLCFNETVQQDYLKSYKVIVPDK